MKRCEISGTGMTLVTTFLTQREELEELGNLTYKQ